MEQIFEDEYEEYAVFCITIDEYEYFYEYYKSEINKFIEYFIEEDFAHETIEYYISALKNNESQELKQIKQSNEYIRLELYNNESNEELKENIENFLEIKIIKQIKQNQYIIKTITKKKDIIKNISDAHEIVEEETNNPYSKASFQLLQDYQNEIINEVIKSFSTNSTDTIYIDAPTGFGKTHMMINIIEILKYKHTLFLSPRIIINEEFEMQFNRLENELNCDIIVDCYQSWEQEEEEYELCEYELIIFDEAHYIMEENIFNFFEFCKEILLSATPNFIPEQANIISQEFTFLNIEHLISVGILADIVMYIESYVADIDFFNEEEKEYHINDNQQFESIIHMIEEFNFKEGVIFFSEQLYCEEFYNFYSGEFEEFLAVSDIESNDIDFFINCEFSCILITCEQIDMGFDCNEIDMICFGSAYQTRSNIMQMIGRGIRQYYNEELSVIIPVTEEDIKIEEYDEIESIIETMIFLELQDEIICDENTILGEYVSETFDIVFELLENQIIPLNEYILLLQEHGIFSYDQYINNSEELELYDFDDLSLFYNTDVSQFIFENEEFGY